MQIRLKDASLLNVKDGASALEAAETLSAGLARNACAARINGKLHDLRDELREGDTLEILTFEDAEGRLAFRHTSSHILAQAVKRLYPETKLAIGPAIEDGFYYDFDREQPFSDDELRDIEAEMQRIVREAATIERFELPRSEAIQFMEEQGEPYKVELIQDLPEGTALSFYRQGDFVDLCAGPHLLSTKAVKAFRLTSVAGAYWRGSEKNKMLTRIYGTSFPKKSDLDAYLERMEEAKRRDHRKIGKEMKLFLFCDEGPGFPFWLPNGMLIKNALLAYWRELHMRNGYQEISTPQILNRRLWETSGHWYHYQENMYTTKIDDEDYAIKPMNCPGGLLVYKSEQHSYRDLPLRFAELGTVHRHEKSGALHGLMRVRCFTQDDAHIYMRPDQITEEIKGVIQLVHEIYSLFHFDYHVVLSTRPDDYMGALEDWNHAEDSLRRALDELRINYQLNEGDGAFYGPKIDFIIKDSLGREWQCGTIQLDFQLPKNFDADYIGADGERHRCIMIHRAIMGSIERFIGILCEHTAGKFPLWLAPEQCRILPISSVKQAVYAEKLLQRLQEAGIRASIDARNEKISYKVREAQVNKVPYMLVVGDKESEEQTLALRRRDSQGNEQMTIDAFIKMILPEIRERRWTEET